MNQTTKIDYLFGSFESKATRWLHC